MINDGDPSGLVATPAEMQSDQDRAKEASNPDELLKTDDEVMAICSDVFNKAPLPLKNLVTRRDWLLILKGLKATTEFDLAPGVKETEEVRNFMAVCGEYGLKFAPSGAGLRRGWDSVYVYNPRILKLQTAYSSMAPKYDGAMRLDDYINQSEQVGYNRDAILGTIYSFPPSAISFYLSQKATGLAMQRQDTAVDEFFGEAFRYSLPAQADVAKRIEQKKEFFFNLSRRQDWNNIVRGEEHKRSNLEWERLNHLS